MTPIKMRIRTLETERELAVIRAMLEIYPLDRELIVEQTDEFGATDFVFPMDVRNIELLNHDIELLHICGYDLRKARS